jgi:hypothetical protein
MPSYGSTGESRGRIPSAVDALRDAADFSLVLGGPLFQLLRRAHMTGDALELVRRRIVTITLIAWLPLLVLSVLQGQAYATGDVVPFLRDVEVQVRFLVALPLLIAAELVVHRRLRLVARQFIDRELIPATAMPEFDAALVSASRLRNSTVAEIALIVLVYGVGVLIVWRHYFALDAAMWYAVPSPAGPKLSLAGVWYGYVSLPIFQFLLVRWYFRFFIWSRFLWRVSRIDLQAIPTHPDRVAGLGFLANTMYAFVPLLVAHGALLAGMIAGRIFYTQATLLDFKVEIAVMVVFLLCLVIGPLLVFTPKLAALKRKAIREYGALAQRYVREFDAKWLRGNAPANESLLGSPDLQALADLDNSLAIVHSMRAAPITRDALIRLAVSVLVPLVPLTLTMMSAEELLQRLLKILF